jgi:hypothetical protein
MWAHNRQEAAPAEARSLVLASSSGVPLGSERILALGAVSRSARGDPPRILHSPSSAPKARCGNCIGLMVIAGADDHEAISPVWRPAI